MDLAQLSVITASDKKNVKTFSQFNPSVSRQDGLEGRLTVTGALNAILNPG
jgi:hypothetical protein